MGGIILESRFLSEGPWLLLLLYLRADVYTASLFMQTP